MVTPRKAGTEIGGQISSVLCPRNYDASPAALRALNQNLLVMMQSGFFIGSLGGGQLISRFGYPALFTTLSALTLVAGSLMLRVRKPLSSEDERYFAEPGRSG